MTFHAQPDTIYLTDNGAAYCGEHLGATARASGRDISGQRIEPITPEALQEARLLGWHPACERCGKQAKPADAAATRWFLPHIWNMAGHCEKCGRDRFGREGLRDDEPCPDQPLHGPSDEGTGASNPDAIVVG